MNDKNQDQEIKRLLSLNRQELLTEVGMQLKSNDFFGKPDFIKRALEWLEEKKGVFYEAICNDEGWLKIKAEKEKHEYFDAFIAMADSLIAPYCGNIPVLTVAVLLFTEGLDQLCGCD